MIILKIQPIFIFPSSLGYCNQVLPFPEDEEKKIQVNQTEHGALKSTNCEEMPRAFGLSTLEKGRLTVTWQQMSSVEVGAVSKTASNCSLWLWRGQQAEVVQIYQFMSG